MKKYSIFHAIASYYKSHSMKQNVLLTIFLILDFYFLFVLGGAIAGQKYEFIAGGILFMLISITYNHSIHKLYIQQGLVKEDTK